MAGPSVHNAATFTMVHGAAITDPSGGATVDTEGRAAIVSILAALRNANLLAGGTRTKAPTVWDPAKFTMCHGAAIADVTTGAVQDAQARTAINGALAVLRTANIIAGTPNPAGPNVTDEDDYTIKFGLALADASGGATIDAQLRTAVNAMLAVLRSANLIALD